ncbi:unnamed protein product [Larinioides sclopetarius]|uniref:Uncharacterized protein n=1 Tax=Larinioides sclopetarius TaxID=280406 RepID=A0AAV2AEV0_9ARAC
MSLMICAVKKILCKNSYKCIRTFLLCDSKDDCLDGSDESRPAPPHGMPVSVLSKRSIILIIVIVAALEILILVFYIAMKTIRAEMLPPKPYNGTVSSINAGNHTGLAVSSFQSSSRAMSGIGMSVPPSASSMYGRNYLKGASSSSSSRTYPLETLNPPPSPVTVRSQCFQGHCSFGPLGSYKHYRSRNKPPPPTPCSTDDSEACSSYYYGSGLELRCDSDPFIHPPIPRSPYLSEENYEFLRCCSKPPSPVPLTDP